MMVEKKSGEKKEKKGERISYVYKGKSISRLRHTTQVRAFDVCRRYARVVF